MVYLRYRQLMKTPNNNFSEAFIQPCEHSGCANSSGTIYDRNTRRIYPRRRCRRRDCPYCRNILAHRIESQITCEEINTWSEIPAGRWPTYKRYMHTDGIRFKSFPQGETVIVVRKDGDNELPEDRESRAEIIGNWIAKVPKRKQVAGTQGFGGEYWAGAQKKSQPGRYWVSKQDYAVVRHRLKEAARDLKEKGKRLEGRLENTPGSDPVDLGGILDHGDIEDILK